MKLLIRMSVSVLVSAALLAVMPISGEHRIYEDVLRLHVIAESDSAEDQALKLKVRDAVLDRVSERVESCQNFDEAYSTVEAMLCDIEKAAETCVAAERSETVPVTVTLSREKYPRRDYGIACLPAGVYPSLRVILGEGEGKNWWCVLFPTVCVRFAEKTADESVYVAAGFTPQEYRIITGDGEWKIKLRVLELLSELFSQNGE